jgi:hypothetical protein
VIRLEVRCCCQPRKLLGHMQLDERLARDGGYVLGARVRGDGPGVDRWSLPIALFDPGEFGQPRRLAVKAEGLETADLVSIFGASFEPLR